MQSAALTDAPIVTPAATSRWGWGAIVIASLLAHALALDALPHWTLDTSQTPRRSEPLYAMLVAAPEPTIAPPPQDTTVPAARDAARARHHATKREPMPEAQIESLSPSIDSVTITPGDTVENAPARQPAAASSLSDASPALPAVPATPPPNAVVAPEIAPAPASVATLRTEAPASAVLRYKVVGNDTKGGTPITYYGIGSVKWTIADGRYAADMEADLDFLLFKVKVLASHSVGAVDETGLAPDRYTETPRKKSTLATNFNRDARRSITFSASQASTPLVAGAQDRLSVLFQIGALLRANPVLATAGGSIDIPVAGVRGDIEPWTFTTLGTEAIDTGMGKIDAAHLRRVARPNTNDKSVDIWIALSEGGYPARIVYTEQNRSTVEMTLERTE